MFTFLPVLSVLRQQLQQIFRASKNHPLPQISVSTLVSLNVQHHSHWSLVQEKTGHWTLEDTRASLSVCFQFSMITLSVYLK